MNNSKITKFHIFTKYVFQCLLVLLEFGGISVAFVCFTHRIEPCADAIDCLERGTLGLALYEFILFVILEAINDGQKDSLITLQSAYKQAILACEEESDILYKKANQLINSQLDNSVLNSIKIRKDYEILRELLAQNNLAELKYHQILVDHQCNAAGLRWKFTLLLRIFK